MPSTEKRSINTTFRSRTQTHTKQVAEWKKSHLLYEKLFAAIRNQINDLEEKDRNRQMWLSLISPYEKLKSLRAKGVMIGKKAFATARKHAKKTGAGSPVAKPQTPTIPTPEEAKEAIRLHLVENSQPTADKFTSRKGVPQNIVRTLLDTTEAIYYSYHKKYEGTPLHVHTKLLQGLSKDRHVRDMSRRKAQSKLNVQENRLSAAETKRLKDCVQTYEEHRQHKTDRQKHMKERIQNLRNGEIVILSDFKKNISLMKGQNEMGNDFFKRPQRTIFGVILFYKKGDKIGKDIFTFVSEDLKHVAHFIISAWEDIQKSNVFLSLGVTRINFWNDNCRGQFRNFQLLSYMIGLREKYTVEIDYFTEYHGKNQCDSHFSRIMVIYNNRTLRKDALVTTTEEFIKVMTDGFNDIPDKEREDEYSIHPHL
ncbi:hypothetical protein PROFUN_04680 [Planoprotostelium fungivorum]|uniref:Uncharacterized protein n=1 Tax=Planoprotostelium fungivorum TaxID=1890364 RepID=A0A2P6NFS2_9EUKA|nr:hypothetical protein PROFUN_04680 [Planoprotostelium fungivorum]